MILLWLSQQFLYNFVPQWHILRPQGWMASCSSFPIDAISLPDFCFNPPVHPRKIPLLWNSGFGDTLLHNRNELLFPQIPCCINIGHITQEWPVSPDNQLVCYVKVSMSIPPDGSFAGFHWVCVTRPLQCDIHSIVIGVTQWWDYTAVMRNISLVVQRARDGSWRLFVCGTELWVV